MNLMQLALKVLPKLRAVQEKVLKRVDLTVPEALALMKSSLKKWNSLTDEQKRLVTLFICIIQIL